MDRNNRDLFTKRSGSFKKKGLNHKKVRNVNHERSSGTVESADTVYRILCPSNKIGSVIGKAGGVIKALRDETHAKITVSDAVPGSDERVIIIYSSPTTILKKQNGDEEGSGAENEERDMEPYCAAQDALLKVHDRILEEDLFGGMTFDDDNDSSDVTIRLLVPSNMVGCLLGRKGDVIQTLRKETGAGIRVLPSQHLPTCAMSTDELVQITGKPDVAKRALYEVSMRLHQNPRKDQQLLNRSMLRTGHGLHHPGGPMPNVPPLGSPMWTGRNSDPYGMRPTPWMGEHGQRPSGFVKGGYDDVPPGPVGEPSEFSLKILCSGEKIRGVIGRGGCNVKQLEQETGASIHVEDASNEDDERVILVSAVETIWNPRSQTIDAILQLQNKTSEFSEGGTITTKLLVPSSKVGCILGQGGHVINEMRRRTRADIRVISKDDKPSCAYGDEELVQVSGNLAVARDALAEILSRLRVRTLRDSNAGNGPPPLGPPLRLASGGSFPAGRSLSSGAIAAGSSGGYEPYKGGEHDYEPRGYPGPRAAAGFLPSSNPGMKGGGGHEYEPHIYPGPRAASGYPDVSSNVELRVLNSSMGSATGVDGRKISNISEIAGGRMKHQDPQLSGSESYFDSHRSVVQSMYEPYMISAAAGTNSRQFPSYHPTNAPHGSYQNIREQQDSYSIPNTQQSPYSRQGAYPKVNAAYQDIAEQRGSYKY
ncbi:KH domain-containing protein HEN4-like isoform X1 [Punica granatum]|uniref:KH domain-containing protein HEN4-like isoform X1 n=1 Tax=Punica granatum TaxID=22663 RepID=A0A6P8DYV2_PUNGR|nr:KH domain-containing protein HEN4-like isoform X1 [Punica granatum]XP_031397559.1 KH domain-containing protein HEN4-like isoform X1 [Punica granatum]